MPGEPGQDIVPFEGPSKNSLEPYSTGGLGSVSQSSITAGGHVAGGGIQDIRVRGDLNIHPPAPKITPLGRLYRKLHEEAVDDPRLTEYIEQLQIFTRVVQDEEVVGLDAKLGASNRADQIDMAKAMKEMIYADLRKNMFSPVFQKIYATLMGKVYEEFQMWVRPAIVKGETREAIDDLIYYKVIQPIVEELEDCADYDGVALPTVRGMLYFLTGNCHLVWH